MKNIFAIWLLPALLMGGMEAGCKKSGSAPSKPTWTPGSDIYIVGQDTGRAVYWKNGVKTVLGQGLGEGIAVSGSDVYVGGVVYKSVGGTVLDLAAYWKDGVEQLLTDSVTGWAYQPVVAEGDVYVPGYVFGPSPQVYAVYWKNGQRVNLDPSLESSASGMAIQDTDIYVVGEVWDGGLDTMLVWKDGQRMSGFDGIETDPMGQILVSGGNIYVAWEQGYYINFGQYVALNTTSQKVGAGSVYLNGSDVYVTGGYDSATAGFAAYWKNGAIVKLPNYPGTFSSGTAGLVVAGSDVYVAGSIIMNGRYLGVYWKNGVEDSLSGNGSAYGIVLGN